MSKGSLLSAEAPFVTGITVWGLIDADKNCPTVWPGVNQRMHWSFEDPAAFEGPDDEKLAKFRQIRDLIEEKIKSWLVEQGITIQ